MVSRTVKYVAIPVVSILLIVVVSGIIVVGGTVDFDHSYDEDGNIILENRSSGLLNDFRWEAIAYSGNSVSIDEEHPYEIMSDSKIKLMTTGIDVFEVTLYCKTIAGVMREMTKEVINGEMKEYVVEFNYPYVDPYVAEDSYSVTVQVSTSDFIAYKDRSINRFPGDSANQALVGEYINVLGNDTIKNIIVQLENLYEENMDNEDKINLIMAFVQNCVVYQEDIETMGAFEYWKYPIETLFTRTGDCEDVSLLTMALFKATFEGSKVALALFWGTFIEPGHAMAAISISGLEIVYPSGSDYDGVVVQDLMAGYKIDDRDYYLCETTSVKWTIGLVGADYNKPPSMLIVV